MCSSGDVDLYRIETQNVRMKNEVDWFRVPLQKRCYAVMCCYGKMIVRNSKFQNAPDIRCIFATFAANYARKIWKIPGNMEISYKKDNK